MAVLGNMAAIGRIYVLPTATGMALVYQNRYSRSLVKGLDEQKISCCFNWITRTSIFVNISKTNIGALFSAKVAHRFSYLNMSSYILMPALYCASKSLEKSDRTYLKETVDQIFRNIPDLILVATIVQNAAAIYFGIAVVQNSILLGFGLLSYLEQGLYITTKREDAGFLHSVFEGKIIRLYNPILHKVNSVSCLGITFYYGGLLGKIYSLAIAIFNAPKFIKDPIFSMGKSVLCCSVSKIVPGGRELIKSIANSYKTVKESCTPR